MRITFALILMAAVGCVEAEIAGYESLNESVHHAAREAQNVGGLKESTTIVYELNGRFFFMPPMNESTDRNRAQGTFMIPPGAVLRFLVHNHTSQGLRLFSYEDIQDAERNGVPSAVIFPDGTIRTFTPGKTRTDSRQNRVSLHRSNSASLTSRGDQFEWHSE